MRFTWLLLTIMSGGAASFNISVNQQEIAVVLTPHLTRPGLRDGRQNVQLPLLAYKIFRRRPFQNFRQRLLNSHDVDDV